MSLFFIIPMLFIFAVLPALFWFKGRQFFGAQTHPAAIFILAWIACGLVLLFSGALKGGTGVVSLVWVALNFTLFAIAKKIRAKSAARIAREDENGSSGEGR